MNDEQKWDILTRPEKLGEILLKHGKINLKQLEDSIKEQENQACPSANWFWQEASCRAKT